MAPRLTFALAPALVALILADAPLHAQLQSRAEGRIAFAFGESGAVHPSQSAVMDADGKNRRALPPWQVLGLSWSPDGRSIAFGSRGHYSRGPYGIATINVDGRPRYRRVVRNGGPRLVAERPIDRLRPL